MLDFKEFLVTHQLFKLFDIFAFSSAVGDIRMPVEIGSSEFIVPNFASHRNNLQPQSLAPSDVLDAASGSDMRKLLTVAKIATNEFISKQVNLDILGRELGKHVLLAYVGARVCYSKYTIDEIIAREIIDNLKPLADNRNEFKEYVRNKIVRFVFNLLAKGHTSIFGLSDSYSTAVFSSQKFLDYRIPELEEYQPHKGVSYQLAYGVWWLTVSARTLAEYYAMIRSLSQNREQLDEKLINIATNIVTEQLLADNKRLLQTISNWFSSQNVIDYKQILEPDTVKWIDSLDPEFREQIQPYLPYIQIKKFNPALTMQIIRPYRTTAPVLPTLSNIPTDIQTNSYYSYGITRITTHQLVRHTSLNFLQRSHRYTKIRETDIVLAKGELESQNRELIQKLIDKRKSDIELYNELIEAGIKPEDARFEISDGIRTAILFSGKRRHLARFLAERTDKAAQWEIRALATAVQQLG